MKRLGRAPTRGARINAVRDFARKMGLHIPGVMVPYQSILDGSPNRIVGSPFSKKTLARQGRPPLRGQIGLAGRQSASSPYFDAARREKVRFRRIPAFSRSKSRRDF